MLLILNCGSQSIKWKLFTDNLKVEKKGKKEVFNSKNYQKVLTEELKKIPKDVEIIGHRVVHGGKKFRKPIKINKNLLKELEKFNELAPLHNPFNILGIKISQRLFPKKSQIAVFDTEFYTDLPERSCIYPLPENIRKKYGFQRLGFHGISHEYAAEQGAKRIKKTFKKLKIITCHLGGGSSITAIKNGRAVDTSMGFTPMEGLMMMTRAGDIDSGIVLELAQKFSLKKVNKILNFESGLKGISGLSDMKKILKAVEKRNKKAGLALEVFVYRIQKYIGAYFAVLGGCDLLVFTGAIGWEDGDKKIKSRVCKNLHFLDKTKVVAIKPNEELAIANKIIRIYK